MKHFTFELYKTIVLDVEAETVDEAYKTVLDIEGQGDNSDAWLCAPATMGCVAEEEAT